MLSKEELERLKDFILFAKANNIVHVNLNGIQFQFSQVPNFTAEPDNTASQFKRPPSTDSKLGLAPEDEDVLYAASK